MGKLHLCGTYRLSKKHGREMFKTNTLPVPHSILQICAYKMSPGASRKLLAQKVLSLNTKSSSYSLQNSSIFSPSINAPVVIKIKINKPQEIHV